MQTVRELRPDIAILSKQYKNLDRQPWEVDATGKAAIWSCNKRPFQETMKRPEIGFVRVKLDGIHVYSYYAPPSWSPEEFQDFLDRLIEDAQGRYPLAIAGDFNAWAVEWGSVETKKRPGSLRDFGSIGAGTTQ